MQVLVPSKELAQKHYAEHDGKPFFPKLVDFLSSGAVVATVWEGKEVVKFGRTMIGATNPLASSPGTIRLVCTMQPLHIATTAHCTLPPLHNAASAQQTMLLQSAGSKQQLSRCCAAVQQKHPQQ